MQMLSSVRAKKAADLPVAQTTEFEVDLQPQQRLGLTIPGSFLSLADEIIE
jgi:hypothetical protein